MSEILQRIEDPRGQKRPWFDREQMRLISQIIVGSKAQIVAGFSCLMISSACVVKSSVFLGVICAKLGGINQLEAGVRDITLSEVSRLIWWFLCLELLSILAQYWGRSYLAKGATRSLFELRKMLFAKLSRLPMAYFDTQPMGRIITRLTNDVEGVEGFFGGGLSRILTACVQLILVLLGMISIAPQFGAYVAISAVPALLFGWLTRKPIQFWLSENKSRNAHLNSTLAEHIQGLPVLRILGLEAWSGDVVSKDANRYLESSLRVLTLNGLIRPLTVLLSVMPTLVTGLLGGWFLYHGRIDLAVVVSILRLTERFSNPVRVLTQEIQIVQDAIACSSRVNEMLRESEETTPIVPKSWPSEGVVAPTRSSAYHETAMITGEIVFENVSLAYKPGVDVLKSLNLLIPSGQKVGIIGATGAGKSSLLNLIPGLYLPYKGAVKIDGRDLREWDLETLRSQIGYLAQDPFLFKGTLGQNILGMVDADKIACQNRFLGLMEELDLRGIFARYDNGLNFHINENGSNLSSGEKQMLLFMRLMYENRPILLMDEATSCLDKSWESAIQKAILGLMRQRKRTCVIIAHRLDTLKSCDRVIRIDGGRVIQDDLPEVCLNLN